MGSLRRCVCCGGSVPREVLYYFEQVFAILGNFRVGMANKFYEEKGQSWTRPAEPGAETFMPLRTVQPGSEEIPSKFRVLTELQGDANRSFSCPV